VHRRHKRITVELFAIALTLALVSGCDGASVREVFVTRAVPSADGTWVWVGQIDQFGTTGAGDAGMDGGVGDAGVDAGMLPPGDVWVARLTDDRLERWQLGVGSAAGIETAESVIELRDGRLAIVGSAMGATDTDAWLLFIDPRGVIAGDGSGQKLLGGPGDQRFVEVVALDNGDVVAVGLATAADGSQGILAARFTNTGDLVWQRLAAMPEATRVRAVHVLRRSDDRLVFVGAVDRPSDMRGLDIWAAAADLDGNLEWQRMLGTTSDDAPGHAVITQDLGLVIASRVVPIEAPSDPDARITGDMWVLRADRGGSVVWQRYFERVGFDEVPRRLVVRDDGRVNVVATADGFGSRNAGDDDIWIVELETDGAVASQRTIASLSPDRPVNVFEEDERSLRIVGVVDERPAYWTIRDDGMLIDGCGIITETDARIVDTSVQVTDGFARWETPTLVVTNSAAGEGRPPPIQALECRLAR